MGFYEMEIKRRKEICENCKFYNKETDTCKIDAVSPEVFQPYLYFQHCDKWTYLWDKGLSDGKLIITLEDFAVKMFNKERRAFYRRIARELKNAKIEMCLLDSFEIGKVKINSMVGDGSHALKVVVWTFAERESVKDAKGMYKIEQVADNPVLADLKAINTLKQIVANTIERGLGMKVKDIHLYSLEFSGTEHYKCEEVVGTGKGYEPTGKTTKKVESGIKVFNIDLTENLEEYREVMQEDEEVS